MDTEASYIGEFRRPSLGNGTACTSSGQRPQSLTRSLTRRPGPMMVGLSNGLLGFFQQRRPIVAFVR